MIIFIAFATGIIFSKFYFNKKQSTEETAEAEEHQNKEGEVELSEKSQELINLKTSKVTLSILKKTIPVIGQIAQDTENLSHIISPNSGVITECKKEIGSSVKKGDVICSMKIDGDGLVEIKSEVSGIVIGDFVKMGDRVNNVTSICTVADLSQLWANFDVYEKDIADVKMGQKITVHSIAYPEKTFEGQIVFISPRVDESSHTIKIRAVVDNKDYSLKLGMFISGEIIFESDEQYLSVPAHAVQSMGNDKIIFIKTSDNKFDFKKIDIKTETKDEVLINTSSQEEKNQIKVGDEVVIESAFLLKSELQKGELEEE